MTRLHRRKSSICTARMARTLGATCRGNVVYGRHACGVLEDGQLRETGTVQACVTACGGVAEKQDAGSKMLLPESDWKWKSLMRLGVAQACREAPRIHSAQTALRGTLPVLTKLVRMANASYGGLLACPFDGGHSRANTRKPRLGVVLPFHLCDVTFWSTRTTTPIPLLLLGVSKCLERVGRCGARHDDPQAKAHSISRSMRRSGTPP